MSEVVGVKQLLWAQRSIQVFQQPFQTSYCTAIQLCLHTGHVAVLFQVRKIVGWTLFSWLPRQGARLPERMAEVWKLYEEGVIDPYTGILDTPSFLGVAVCLNTWQRPDTTRGA